MNPVIVPKPLSWNESTEKTRNLGIVIGTNSVTFTVVNLPFPNTFQWAIKEKKAIMPPDNEAIQANTFSTEANQTTKSIIVDLVAGENNFIPGKTYYIEVRIVEGNIGARGEFTIDQNVILDQTGVITKNFASGDFTKSGNTITTTNKVVDLLGEIKTQVVVGKANADFITDGVDDQVTIQAAIDSLTAGRTWQEVVLIKDDVILSNEVIVPSFTKIIIQEVARKTAGWATTSLAPKGYFRLQQAGGVVTNVDISGYFKGNCFSSYPILTVGQNEHILAVFSNDVVKDSNFTIMPDNIGCPIRLNAQGKINGNPGNSVNITVIGRDVIVGPEIYSNGYKMENCNILYSNITNCLDDLAAVIGHGGGIVGAEGIAENCNILTVLGSRNSDGSRGGGCAKLDAGSTTIGKGKLINCAVNYVNVKSSTGTNEGAVAIFNNQISENIFIGTVIGNNLDYHVYYQGGGIGLIIDKTIGNSNYGVILQSSVTPNNNQSITVNNLLIDSKDKTTKELQGITFCAGSAGQGFRNVKIKGDIKNKAIPINEGTPNLPSAIVGNVVSAVVENVVYDVDIRNAELDDNVLTSINRTAVFYKNGLKL